MSMTFLNQLSVIPALFITLACMLLLRDEKIENSRSRLLLFLLGLGVLLLATFFVTMRYFTEPYNQPFFQLSNLLASSMLGITALILLTIKAFANMGKNARSIAILLGVVMGVMYGFLWNTQFGLGYLVLPGVLVLVIGWSVGRRFSRLVPILGLLSLGVFFLFIWLMNHPPSYADSPVFRAIGSLVFITFYVVPSLSVVVSALLVTASLQSLHVQERDGVNVCFRRVWLVGIGFAIILIVFLAYIIFCGSVWDQTSDGLFGHFALQPSALVAIGVGMVMTLALSGVHRLAGMVFIVAVPLMLYQSFEAGWHVSYHEITERRASRIAQALDRFHVREGYYPESLDSLTPRDLLFIQQPVILAGEKWCYEGGEDYYRLTAFYREFFSSPVSLRVYKSTRELPAGPSACEGRLAAMKEKYYSPMENPEAMRPPLPTPLPEIEVGIPKIEIQPVLDGAVALPGWRPKMCP